MARMNEGGVPNGFAVPEKSIQFISERISYGGESSCSGSAVTQSRTPGRASVDRCVIVSPLPAVRFASWFEARNEYPSTSS